MSFDARKALGNRVLLLAGEEEALRRSALKECIALATEDGDFDLQTFEADAAPPSEWLAGAGTAPFLSKRRTVIVRHISRCDPTGGSSEDDQDTDVPGAESKAASSRLSASMRALPDSSLLILVAEEEIGDEGRQRRLAGYRKAWEKIVKDGEGLVAEFKPDTQQIKAGIKREAERLGKKISDAGAESLADMTGSSYSRAVEELEKLAVYTGTEVQIREADIRAVVMPAREWNVFKLIDSIVDGSVAEALRQLRILVGSPTKAEQAAFSRILPMMSRQLRLMWQARLCVEAKCSPDTAPDSVRNQFPERPNLAKEPSYRQGRLIQQARRTDLQTLCRCLQAVADADAALKGLRSSFSSIEVLEQMVLEMAHVLSPKTSNQVRRTG